MEKICPLTNYLFPLWCIMEVLSAYQCSVTKYQKHWSFNLMSLQGDSQCPRDTAATFIPIMTVHRKELHKKGNCDAPAISEHCNSSIYCPCLC